MTNTLFHRKLFIGALISVSMATLQAQDHRTWEQYLGGPDSSHYSSLKQINRSNVSKLQVAWTYPTGDAVSYSFNPIIVGKVMYVLAHNFNVVALDAATGKEIWRLPTRDPKEPLTKGRGTWAVRYRGMNYWQSKDGKDKRLFLSAYDHLQAIDASTGKFITTFGKDGKVDLRANLNRDPNSITQIMAGSPGRIFENLIILGSTTGEEYMSPPGDIRAYDVRTGELAWQFHTIPHPGESGYETWPKDAWKYIGGANNWGGMSVDEARGMVYIPIGSAVYDFYGADRLGNDLYANSVIALNARTGKLVWYYQTVHHDVWDYDLTAEPQLMTIQHDGKKEDVVVQAGKTGFVYVLDRDTGKPIWPIEERPVPQSDMPGEKTSPTQPIPTKPAPFARQTFSSKDLNPYYLSDEERAEWKVKLDNAVNKGMFTPPGITDTVQMPGNHGGANWGSTAKDPRDGTFYVLSSDIPAILKLLEKKFGEPIPSGTSFDQGHAIYAQNCQLCHGTEKKGNPPSIPSLVGSVNKLGVEGFKRQVLQGGGEMPAFARMDEPSLKALVAFVSDEHNDIINPPIHDKAEPPAYPDGTGVAKRYWSGYGLESTIISPPWSTLTAYDLNKGDIKWQIPVGNAPEVGGQTKSDGGVMNLRNGIAITAGDVIFLATIEEGKLRAYDSADGKVLWEVDLPAGAEGVPSIYEVNGKEYLVVCATSPKGAEARRAHGNSLEKAKQAIEGSYIVYALPGTTK